MSLWPPLLALLLAGCSNSFDLAAYVSSLRLLAVKAEPPELAGGATTRMTATWANPGKGAPTIDWDYCKLAPPPGSGSSINQSCAVPEMGANFIEPIGSGPSVTFTMPTLPIDMTPMGLLRLASQLDSTDGYYVTIRLRLHDDTQSLTAIYGLRYFLGALSPNPPNQNPTLLALYRVPEIDASAAMQTEIVDGTPPEVHKNDVINLRTLLAPASAEPYKILTGSPTTGKLGLMDETEAVNVAWFATAGSFTNATTGIAEPNNTWTLDKHLPPSGATIDMWMVARDQRGGTDTLHRAFIFR